jgi:hypothetical protein
VNVVLVFLFAFQGVTLNTGTGICTASDQISQLINTLVHQSNKHFNRLLLLYLTQMVPESLLTF